MREPAPASSTAVRPIITDDAFHGGEDIPLTNARFTDTGFGRKRAIPAPHNESADVVPPIHVRRSPAGAISLPPMPPVAPAGAS